VSRSGFYARPQKLQNPGCRDQDNIALTSQVQVLFERHRGFSGAQRFHKELRTASFMLGRHRVARLMRTAGAKAKTRRGFSPCRNSAGKTAGIAENLQ
jgi:putative transposase